MFCCLIYHLQLYYWEHKVCCPTIISASSLQMPALASDWSIFFVLSQSAKHWLIFESQSQHCEYISVFIFYFPPLFGCYFCAINHTSISTRCCGLAAPLLTPRCSSARPDAAGCPAICPWFPGGIFRRVTCVKTISASTVQPYPCGVAIFSSCEIHCFCFSLTLSAICGDYIIDIMSVHLCSTRSHILFMNILAGKCM